MLIRYLFLFVAVVWTLGAVFAAWFNAARIPDGDRLPRIVVEAGKTVLIPRRFMFGGVAIVAVPEGTLRSEERLTNDIQAPL